MRAAANACSGVQPTRIASEALDSSTARGMGRVEGGNAGQGTVDARTGGSVQLGLGRLDARNAGSRQAGLGLLDAPNTGRLSSGFGRIDAKKAGSLARNGGGSEETSCAPGGCSVLALAIFPMDETKLPARKFLTLG